MNPKLSVVIPVHNEEGNIKMLYEELKGVLDSLRLTYEVVFVNDGSTDATSEILQEIQRRDVTVRVVELDGNFGEAAALSAGYLFSRGEWIVTMDGDGQNDPRDIPKVLNLLERGYKAVSGWRKKRQEPFFTRVLPSRVANWLISKVTGCKVHDTGCGLKGYRAEVVKGFQIPHGFHRFLPALFGLKSDDVGEVIVNDRKRGAGRSHYGLKRTWEVIRELLTIKFVLWGPERWHRKLEKAEKGLLALALLFGITALVWPFWPLFLLFLLSCSLLAVFHVVVRNLERFLKVKSQGAFKVKAVWEDSKCRAFQKS